MLRLFLALAVMALSIFAVPARAGEGVALVGGDGYGHSEVASLIENVLKPYFSDTPYEETDFLHAGEYERYRIVILAGENSERKYTVEETQQIEDYISKGGRLVMIRQSPSLFPADRANASDPPLHPFGRSFYWSTPVDTGVLRPDSALLMGMPGEVAESAWHSANVLLKGEDWDAVIGTESFILVGEKNHGSGKIYYLGSELFRMRKADAAGWIQLLKNILSQS